jgi:uncharacterized DUF497 family protein
MIITWDEPKRIANLELRGLDFAALTEEFFLEAKVGLGHSGRFKAIGMTDDGMLCVVFAQLGTEGISIVSMRRASVKERKAYYG